jgi:hypothetical protein
LRISPGGTGRILFFSFCYSLMIVMAVGATLSY